MISSCSFRKMVFLIWLAVSFIPLLVYGQSFDNKVYDAITIEADSVAQLGKSFHLKFHYNTKDSTDRILTPIWKWNKYDNNYQILMGPSRSTQTSTYITNGKVTTTYSDTFTFLISFEKEGRIPLPPMQAETGKGRKLLSKPFTVRVTRHPVVTSKGKSSIPIQSKNDLLVVEATFNKNHIKLGDSIECEIRLYTTLDISQMSASATLPISSAYWHEHPQPTEKNFEKVVYQGDSVHSILWQKATVFPLQAGDIVLKPMKFTATRRISNPDIDPFEAFFNGGNPYSEIDTIISTSPVVVHVEDACQPKSDIQLLNSNSTKFIGLVIDRSSSLKTMSESLAPSFSQIENTFIEKLLKEKVIADYSITFFAGRPYYSKSTNLSSIIKTYPSEENDGSAVYDAILTSALRDRVLTTERSPYSILLLTDGYDNKSRISEQTITNLLLKHNIRLDVIAFASKNDSVYYQYNDTIGTLRMKNTQDFSDVERIARETNGTFVLIENQKQIDRAIAVVRKSVQKKNRPIRQPDKDFVPNPYLLYNLYKEIESLSLSNF